MRYKQDITRNVMRRVWMLYAWRMALMPRTHYIGIAVAGFVIALSVSLKDVAANVLASSSSFSGLLYYLIDALLTTDVVVQFALFLFGLFVILAARDICLYCVSGGMLLVRKRT